MKSQAFELLALKGKAPLIEILDRDEKLSLYFSNNVTGRRRDGVIMVEDTTYQDRWLTAMDGWESLNDGDVLSTLRMVDGFLADEWWEQKNGDSY